MTTDGRTEKQSLPVLLREDRGAVSILTLNRPEKLNALSNELISAVMAALDGIELDRAIRAIVFTGMGRAFSSGADIAAFQRHLEAGPTEAVVHFMRPGHQMTRRVESFPKPIIAAVNGFSIRWRVRTSRGHPHRPCGGERFLLQGRDKHRDHSDVRRHPAIAAERWS